jgi:hypothetical protein
MPNARNLQVLRQLRRRFGISQSDAAAFFFKGQSARNTISDWENGNEIPPVKHRGCLRNIRFGHPKALKPDTSLISIFGFLMQ